MAKQTEIQRPGYEPKNKLKRNLWNSLTKSEDNDLAVFE